MNDPGCGACSDDRAGCGRLSRGSEPGTKTRPYNCGDMPMRPLEDVRIIALEQYGAGPFGSLHLADMGAEVFKIEDPHSQGDVGRFVPPFQEGEDSLFFETFNRNKRSLSLDVTTPAGRAVLEDLVKVSDAVYSNLRGDVPAQLRITYGDLEHLNPEIVCCSLSGFGMTGPRASEPGYDYILQGLAGWMDLTGEPGGPPTKSGISLVDYSGGLVAAISLLVGVHAARRDGRGMDCDVSLFDTAVGLLTYLATWHLSRGYEPRRTARSAHPSLVPFQNFPTADGWIVVCCPKEKFWERLTDEIGQPSLANDARFSSFPARSENAVELLGILESAFRQQTSAHWLDRLGKAGVPCGPVNSMADAVLDAHTEERGLIVETEHAKWGTVRQVASPVRVGGYQPRYRRAPLRNEDADFILHELLGYGGEEVETLLASGAAG
jgi:crotonobetainyl-CoA:carnitine CoA-transferase CaiB-like acyl-CoA transferase